MYGLSKSISHGFDHMYGCSADILNQTPNALGMGAARSAASSERSERLAPTGYVLDSGF